MYSAFCDAMHCGQANCLLHSHKSVCSPAANTLLVELQINVHKIPTFGIKYVPGDIRFSQIRSCSHIVCRTLLQDHLCHEHALASRDMLSVALQATKSAIKGAEATPLLVATAAMVATTMATMPMEETTTVATTVAMAAMPRATMAMVVMEVTLTVVSLSIILVPKSV